MQTPKDFQNAIEDTFDNESAADACYELAKKMSLEFAKYAAADYEYYKDGKWQSINHSYHKPNDEELFTEWQNSQE